MFQTGSVSLSGNHEVIDAVFDSETTRNHTTHKNYKDRLEKISDVGLPANFKVLKDEYQDMWQDYCILYDIQFDKNATTELIKGIKTAKFYNSNVNPNSMLYDSLFITVDKEKAIWCKSEKGYRFSRQDGLTTYSIELDTMTNILKYNECAD